MDDLIFALDIGTRSVVGVVCENKNGILKVIEIKSVFHNQRSMVDGQIEDIAEVSRIVGIVKSSIEKSLDIKLRKVCIAAAGRALKTERINLEKDSDIRVPISSDFKGAIETEALQFAQDLFSKGSPNSDLFYCVGYSVLGYTMDGKSIINIEGHRANKVTVEIIAAFLPHTVIEGLYSCMDNNDLEVSNLTLEPIAAMDLIIPSELRLLNLALIDIGAGTSDIAISKDGSVVGYDMATIAGDEITELIMKNYLVDFNTAEEIKSSLSDDSNFISITNILGITQNTEKKVILESVKTAVYDLCADVALKITKLNKESPAAVFLVGGGSKTPFLTEFLSELLNISPLRVAMTEKKSLHNVDLSALDYFGPELITPIGIAYSVILNKNYDFFSVTVNNKKIRLYGIRQMKVMDSILMSGFDTKKLIGFSGKSLRFLLDGKQYYYSGEFSTPSQIYVNSSAANIEAIIHPGDNIEVVPAINGASPVVKISDITENTSKGFIYFNGIKTELLTRYFLNNIEIKEDYMLKNSDSIVIIKINTIRDLYKLYKLDVNLYNNFVKGNMVDLDFELYDGCIIDIFSIEKIVKIESIKEDVQKSDRISQITSTDKINANTAIESSIKVTVNNKLIDLPQRQDNMPYIFADMLNYTNIDPSKPKGNIVLLHNGKEASYLNLVSNNDVIIIKWDCD